MKEQLRIPSSEVLDPPVEHIVFDAMTLKREKDMRHNRNLHGGPGFDGHTGFYHGTYYDKGTPRIPKKKQNTT